MIIIILLILYGLRKRYLESCFVQFSRPPKTAPLLLRVIVMIRKKKKKSVDAAADDVDDDYIYKT